MQTRRLGKTGLQVSEIGFGAEWLERHPEEEGVELIHYAADAGINITVIGTAIAFTSMFAYLTYAAAGPAPLLLGKEGIESKFVWSKGVLALVIYAVAATVVFSLLGYIL